MKIYDESDYYDDLDYIDDIEEPINADDYVWMDIECPFCGKTTYIYYVCYSCSRTVCSCCVSTITEDSTGELIFICPECPDSCVRFYNEY